MHARLVTQAEAQEICVLLMRALQRNKYMQLLRLLSLPLFFNKQLMKPILISVSGKFWDNRT